MDRAIERNKGLRTKHLIWGIGVIIVLILIYKIVFGGYSTVYRAERERLTISTVTKDIFNDYISVIGQVEPISTIYLDAVEGGRVTVRIIDEGSLVKRGDIILRLENRQLYQTILNSEAALAEKENYLRDTRVSFEAQQIQSKKELLDNEYMLTRKYRTYYQNETLYKQKYISREEYIRSKEDYEYEVRLQELNKLKAKNDSLLRITSMITLESDLEKMRQMLDLVRERLGDLNVKAPVDGQLGMLDAEVGQLISAGQRIGQINVLTDYKVNARIDQHYIDRVTRGLTASIERGGSLFTLTVRKVYPEVREDQFKVEMVFSGDGPDNIRTGQTFQVKLELGESNEAIMIPRGGFFQSTGGQWIFVLNDDQTRAVRRPVKISKQNPQYYEITDGLVAGEKVITSGYEFLGDADKIVFK